MSDDLDCDTTKGFQKHLDAMKEQRERIAALKKQIDDLMDRFFRPKG